MSLIHEALKKAEAQRHLGEAPTLSSPAFARRRRRRWLLPLVVMAILLTGAYLVWTFWPASHGNTAGVAKTAAPHVASTSLAAPALDSTPPAPAPAPAPNKVLAQPAANPPAPVRTPAAATPVGADHAPQKPPATTPAPAAQPKATPAPPPTAAIKPLSEPAPAESAATPANASTSTLPMYWQLPYAERKDLPDLKVSMHVYAPEAADRFVIINGERLVEGDDLGGGITLVEIRRDGIVVGLSGKQFVVPSASVP